MIQFGLFFIILFITGCGGPIDSFYDQVKQYGYIPYTTPLSFAGTGTLVGGNNPRHLSIVEGPQTCFADEVYGEPTGLRLKDKTVLPDTYQRIYIENNTQAKFFKVISFTTRFRNKPWF